MPARERLTAMVTSMGHRAVIFSLASRESLSPTLILPPMKGRWRLRLIRAGSRVPVEMDKDPMKGLY